MEKAQQAAWAQGLDKAQQVVRYVRVQLQVVQDGPTNGGVWRKAGAGR